MSHFNIYCISAGRPGNVPNMNEQIPGLLWIVPEAEAGEYRAFGAKVLDQHQTGLSHGRNIALDHAQQRKLWCVMTDDDLRGVRWWDGDHKIAYRPTDAAISLISGARKHGCHLAGGAVTDNTFFFKSDVSLNLYIRDGFTATSPDSPLRYDENLKLKMDYDMVLQHLDKYGRALRINRLMFLFQQRTNRGGCQQYRSPEEEAKAVAYLKEKWPGKLRDNPRRPNEVLLAWKA